MNNDNNNPLPAPCLTLDQAKALQLLAQWKKQTVEAFCLDAIRAGMYHEYWELREAAGMSSGIHDAQKAWAAKFFDQVEPLMGESEEDKALFRSLFGLDEEEAKKERMRAIIREEYEKSKKRGDKKGGAK